MIYRYDGTIHPGPRSDYTTYGRLLQPNTANVGFGDRTLLIGSFRLGDVDGWHASISHRDWYAPVISLFTGTSIIPVDGYTATIFKGDGTIHNGPRQDWNTNDR